MAMIFGAILPPRRCRGLPFYPSGLTYRRLGLLRVFGRPCHRPTLAACRRPLTRALLPISSTQTAWVRTLPHIDEGCSNRQHNAHGAFSLRSCGMRDATSASMFPSVTFSFRSADSGCFTLHEPPAPDEQFRMQALESIRKSHNLKSIIQACEPDLLSTLVKSWHHRELIRCVIHRGAR